MAATDETKQRKLELVNKLNESRQAITGAQILLCEQLSLKTKILKTAVQFPSRVRQSITQKPVKWLSGVLLSGVVASTLRFRAKSHPAPAKNNRSFVSSLVTSVLRPIIKTFLMKKLQDILIKRANASAAPTPPSA